MFSGCENIKYIHFTNFNKSNVNDMRWMFNECLSTINIPPKFDKEEEEEEEEEW